MAAGFISVWWPASNRNGGRLHVGKPGRNKSESAHDATMRIEGEAPKQQQPILFPGAETMGGRRATATSDRFLAVSSLCAPRCQNFFFLPVADYAAECSLKPSGMTPSFA